MRLYKLIDSVEGCFGLTSGQQDIGGIVPGFDWVRNTNLTTIDDISLDWSVPPSVSRLDIKDSSNCYSSRSLWRRMTNSFGYVNDGVG
jgi:hypothetical protein